jgi:hypothetical protein
MDFFLLVAGGTVGGLLLVAFGLGLLPGLGSVGRTIGDALCRAPLLDVLITYFTMVPPVTGAIVGGWLGLFGGIIGQIVSIVVWTQVHELVHRKAVRGPRIVKENNRIVGRLRNHAALWVTSLAVPAFWLLRLTELVVYPFLIVLVRFPKYKQGEWVNVSRHKFSGLVGHDLIWCLYCDWMTGIWSLGSDMLRNLESFWCPIRFYSGKKCDNCVIDFPDLDNGWVAADGSMDEVAKVIRDRYPKESATNAWFGHPTRLTVKGERVNDEKSESDSA